MMRKAVWLAFGVVLATGWAGAGEEGEQPEELDDVILTHPRRPSQPPVKVYKDDWISTEGKKGPVTIKVPAYDMLDVEYKGAPRSYLDANRMRRENQLKKACELYIKTWEDWKAQGKQPKWGEEYVFGHLGLVYAQRAGFDPKWYKNAIAYLERIVRHYPESRFIFACYPALGDCFVGRALSYGKEEAKEAFADLKKAVELYEEAKKKFELYEQKTRSLSSAYTDFARYQSLRCDFGKANALYEKARLEQALGQKEIGWMEVKTLFRRVWRTGRRMPETEAQQLAVKSQEKLGLIMIAIGETHEAKRLYEQTIEEFRRTNDQKLLASLPAAYLGLGMCHYQEAMKALQEKDETRKQLELGWARWYFLHVIVCHFEERDLLAKAHYLAGRCYEMLLAVEKDRDKEAQNKMLRHWRLVCQLFPESEFAGRAKEKLGEYGAVEETGAGKAKKAPPG